MAFRSCAALRASHIGSLWQCSQQRMLLSSASLWWLSVLLVVSVVAVCCCWQWWRWGCGDPRKTKDNQSLLTAACAQGAEEFLGLVSAFMSCFYMRLGGSSQNPKLSGPHMLSLHISPCVIISCTPSKYTMYRWRTRAHAPTHTHTHHMRKIPTLLE